MLAFWAAIAAMFAYWVEENARNKGWRTKEDEEAEALEMRLLAQGVEPFEVRQRLEDFLKSRDK